MEKVKKCKISFKNKDGKIIMQERGYCDKNNPNKISNKDTETDFRSMNNAMDKIMEDD